MRPLSVYLFLAFVLLYSACRKQGINKCLAVDSTVAANGSYDDKQQLQTEQYKHSSTTPTISTAETLDYLNQFGYLNEAEASQKHHNAAIGPNEPVENLKLIPHVSQALKNLQLSAGLEPTGSMNTETEKFMQTPRCGIKDSIQEAPTPPELVKLIKENLDKDKSSNNGKHQNYSLGESRWGPNKRGNLLVTYRISKYPTQRQFRGRKQLVDQELARAFKVWSEVVPIDFEQRQRRRHANNGRRGIGGKTTLDIRFVEGDHGDNSPFDGKGKVLAHAILPSGKSYIHFDNSESWTINTRRGINFMQTAAHEIGHALGLLHSRNKTALMYPAYHYDSNFKLDPDDVAGIQKLYGTRLSGVNGAASGGLNDMGDNEDEDDEPEPANETTKTPRDRSTTSSKPQRKLKLAQDSLSSLLDEMGSEGTQIAKSLDKLAKSNKPSCGQNQTICQHGEQQTYSPNKNNSTEKAGQQQVQLIQLIEEQVKQILIDRDGTELDNEARLEILQCIESNVDKFQNETTTASGGGTNTNESKNSEEQERLISVIKENIKLVRAKTPIA